MAVNSGRLVFRIGDAFPANPTVSVFVTAISIALNDLVMTNKLILRSVDEDPSSSERLYLLRLSFSQLHELRETIKHASKGDRVQTFLAGLAETAQADLAQVKSLNTAEDVWIEDAINYVRNQTFHYGGRWGWENLEWAMAAVADLEGDIDMVDPTVGGMRLRFADEVVNQHFTRKFPEYAEDPNAEPDEAVVRARTSTLFKTMSVATSAAIRFTTAAVDRYLETLPTGVVRSEPNDD